MEAKAPEKKMPSTAAKAMRRVPKVEFLSEIHRRAQSAFLRMQGTRRERVSGRQQEEILKDMRLTRVNGIKEVLSLRHVADVCVDEEGVGLGVDILHHDLEAVEAASFGDLDFAAEALNKILVDYAIRGGEKGKDV